MFFDFDGVFASRSEGVSLVDSSGTGADRALPLADTTSASARSETILTIVADGVSVGETGALAMRRRLRIKFKSEEGAAVSKLQVAKVQTNGVTEHIAITDERAAASVWLCFLVVGSP